MIIAQAVQVHSDRGVNGSPVFGEITVVKNIPGATRNETIDNFGEWSDKLTEADRNTTVLRVCDTSRGARWSLAAYSAWGAEKDAAFKLVTR